MANDWIGLVINGQYHHGDRKVAIREICQIFGKDLLDYKVVCSPVLMETGEYYFLIRCNNYSEYIEPLGKSMAVIKVIPSITNPYLFSDEEVNDFSGSVDKPDKIKELESGDMVLVNDGYLKGLYGIVINRLKNGKYTVAFSFYMRKFKDNLTEKCLEFVAKVVEEPQTPRGTTKRSHLVNSHKIHRQRRREHSGI